MIPEVPSKPNHSVIHCTQSSACTSSCQVPALQTSANQSLGCQVRHAEGITPGKAQLGWVNHPHTERLGSSTDSFMLQGNIYLLLLPQTPLTTLASLSKRFPTPGRNEAGTLQMVFVTTDTQFNPRRDWVLRTK